MSEIYVVDDVSFQGWDYEKQDQIGSWNGRLVHLLGCDQRMESILIKNHDRDVNWDVKGEVKFEWGGADGAKASVGVGGSIHDSQGNSASGKVEQHSDGTGSASLSAEKSSEQTPDHK